MTVPYLRSEYGKEFEFDAPVKILDKLLHAMCGVHPRLTPSMPSLTSMLCACKRWWKCLCEDLSKGSGKVEYKTSGP